MKRIIFALTILLLAGTAISAQTRLDAVAPKDARTMAMGGAFIAMSEGYQSLYGNPATFADKKIEFTVLSLNPWMYVRPTTDNISTFQSIANTLTSGGDDPAAVIDPLSDLIVDNGFGAGMSTGIGWIGKGLGLGLIGSGEAYIAGNTLLGAIGTLDAQIAGVVGIGVPLQLGPFRFQVGGDVRPYLRMTGEIKGTDMIGLMTGEDTEGNPYEATSLPVGVGFGLAVDLGARMDIGKMVSVGLAVRDISTKQTYSESTFGDVVSSLGAGELPAGSDAEYSMAPNVTLGASISPITGPLSKLFDVTVIAEIQDPVNVYLDKSSVWNVFHLGVEADFLGGLMSLRTGLNKGWISLGAGISLLVLDFNVALFTEEMGPRPGDSPRTGIAAEVSIRL
jgi:hypothetical protein